MQDKQAVQKWAYRHAVASDKVYWENGFTINSADAQEPYTYLAQRGNEGWELTSTYVDSDGKVNLIFKRPKSSDLEG